MGEFFGHIVRAVRTDPTKERTRIETKRSEEEERRGGVTLRRTTIEEIELPLPSQQQSRK